MHPVLIAGYVALFVALGAAFLFVNLLIGRLVRPRAPNAEKLEVYECGEPTIGSSFVQFDLRFYVVALLFIIFELSADAVGSSTAHRACGAAPKHHILSESATGCDQGHNGPHCAAILAGDFPG